MSQEKDDKNKQNAEPQVEAATPEAIEKIKNPPTMEMTMRQESPEELKSDPAISPEMLNEPNDL